MPTTQNGIEKRAKNPAPAEAAPPDKDELCIASECHGTNETLGGEEAHRLELVQPRGSEVDLVAGCGRGHHLHVALQLVAVAALDGHGQHHLVQPMAFVLHGLERLLDVEVGLVLLRVGGLVAAPAQQVGLELVVGQLQGAHRLVGMDGLDVDGDGQRAGQL